MDRYYRYLAFKLYLNCLFLADPTSQKSICPNLSDDLNQTTGYIEQEVIVPSCVEANGTITISTVIKSLEESKIKSFCLLVWILHLKLENHPSYLCSYLAHKEHEIWWKYQLELYLIQIYSYCLPRATHVNCTEFIIKFGK